MKNIYKDLCSSSNWAKLAQTGLVSSVFLGFLFHEMVKLQLKVQFLLVQSGLSLVFFWFYGLDFLTLPTGPPNLMKCHTCPRSQVLLTEPSYSLHRSVQAGPHIKKETVPFALCKKVIQLTMFKSTPYYQKQCPLSTMIMYKTARIRNR